uniref:Uncharacterized protein n=1 Tax=Octopus bimaculoides TaxID=37653 RepID=A0A0L8FIP2_OCTBM
MYIHRVFSYYRTRIFFSFIRSLCSLIWTNPLGKSVGSIPWSIFLRFVANVTYTYTYTEYYMCGRSVCRKSLVSFSPPIEVASPQYEFQEWRIETQ